MAVDFDNRIPGRACQMVSISAIGIQIPISSGGKPIQGRNTVLQHFFVNFRIKRRANDIIMGANRLRAYIPMLTDNVSGDMQ